MRFPSFEGEWEVKKLGEIAEKIGDGLHGTPSYTDESNYYFINGNNLINGKIEITENTKKIDAKTFLKNDKNLRKNTLLISINGTIGNIAKYNNENVMLGKSVGYFNFEENSDFLYFVLQTSPVQEHFKSELTGSTIKNLSLKTLRETNLRLPSQDEQQKVASFLSLIDERITTQSKILIHLKSLIESLNDSLSKQKIRINSNFENWKKVRLGDLGYTFNGLSGKTKEDFGNGKRYIQYKQIFDSSKIAIENCGYVNVSENENQNSVKYGDIFFTISSETPDEIGMSSVLLEDVKNVYLNSFCFGFRLNSFNEMLPEFARFLFRSKVVRNEIKKLAQGSTRYNMSKTELLKLEILLPSIKEQKEISALLSSLDQKIQTEKSILEQLEMQKKYLLQQMFV
ncbi:restriction endonuclease subunit S [Elizabethkingia anophelis]|nr:restriction endonuclease subunit S [Elizabethkingia anophelis]MCT3633652.1 restriction endonuclease subunit S [Elizabethkingia anophelis]MCT3830415.1 restriction endonuclease subunit S [Elizabethkingia anophelis]MCT3883856.1 restriction endonuclease subunit S [Elizabethkingia anophelis]MCT3894624.1 restriction endonuclease subunit S [Elizabethkingia anophelis]